MWPLKKKLNKGENPTPQCFIEDSVEEIAWNYGGLSGISNEECDTNLQLN